MGLRSRVTALISIGNSDVDQSRHISIIVGDTTSADQFPENGSNNECLSGDTYKRGARLVNNVRIL